jgi:SpoVK/Ycf46/Vps4 family AAA+-type ATPase
MSEQLNIFEIIDLDIRFREFVETTNNKLNNMWAFMMYNNFCDKEVMDLKQTNNKLKKELEENTTNMFSLKLKYEQLKNKVDPPNNKRKSNQANLDVLASEFKKIKRYKKSSPDLIDDMATEIFKKLNNIYDIINLKNLANKFDFMSNNKFRKLYNIIPSLEELTTIVGMNNVKEKVFRSICYFLHDINEQNSNEMNHIMIMGPPGVGKTTIAKIMGSIYLKLGFLENDTFITATRSDLVAKYLGQTADKTQKVIDSALGGVLFIDEVYSLGCKEGRDSFAKECIDTINLNMSRTDRPWLLIVGGYKEEIEESFLAFNKGLERRFTIKLEINGYNETELLEILNSFIIQEKWELEDNAINEKDIKDNIDRFKYFGGDMRKLFQLAKENYCVRSMKTSLTLNGLHKKLSRDDFQKSIEQFKVPKEDKTSHSMMYI